MFKRVSQEALAAALALVYGDGHPPLTDHEYGAAAIFAALPAEPADAGLREALEAASGPRAHRVLCPCAAIECTNVRTALATEPAGAGLRVRILIQGGLVKDMYPGSVWRVERIDSLYKPSGIVGEDAAESTVIDFAAFAAEPADAGLREALALLREAEINLLGWHDRVHKFLAATREEEHG